MSEVKGMTVFKFESFKKQNRRENTLEAGVINCPWQCPDDECVSACKILSTSPLFETFFHNKILEKY